ncbi:MAG: hypothetical protein IJV24_07235 [Prevotella sp.]|nr:hypothetical protein [Prevotella sp.]
MREIQLPEEKIQQMAEKYAMEGAEKAVKEYYTGFQSPYIKAVKEHLERIAPAPRFNLPDITATINKALSDRIMDLCNEVMTHTYAKLFNRMLTPNENNRVTTQEMFQKFGDYIKEREGDDFDENELEFEGKTSKYSFSDGFRYLEFRYKGEVEFNLTVWNDENDEDGKRLYTLSSLPGRRQYDRLDNRTRYAKITLEDGKTAEVPIIDDVLSNDFLAYLANLLICKTKIVIDNYHEWRNYDY